MRKALAGVIAAALIAATPAAAQDTPPTYEELQAQVAALTTEVQTWKVLAVDAQDELAYCRVDLRVANDAWLEALAAKKQSAAALRNQLRAERVKRREYVGNVRRFIARLRAQFLTPAEGRRVLHELDRIEKAAR